MTNNEEWIAPADDLFGEDYVPARTRQPQALPPSIEDMTDEERAEMSAKHRSIRNRKKSTRRKPENKQLNAIRDHLFKVYGAVTTRVNSGEWIDEAGNTIRGAEAGTSDVLACVPIRIGTLLFGIYFAFEVKSLENKSPGTPAQQKFIARVRSNGGYGAVVRTPIDADEAISACRQQLIDQLRAFYTKLG